MSRSILLAVSFAALASTSLGCGGRPEQGARLSRKVTVGGFEREYLVHRPKSVDGSKKVPVVFMLHGTSGDGQKFYNISGWVEKADAEGFIAVFPSALTYCLGDDDDHDGAIEANEWTITSKWAMGSLGTAKMPMCPAAELEKQPAAQQATVQSSAVADDLAFFDAMVDAVKTDFPVDDKRLYVTGFSNGGQMAARLMVERSTVFAAFAVAAASLDLPNAGVAARPAPLYFSVGEVDDRFLGATGLPSLPLDATISEVPAMKGILGSLAVADGLDPNVHTFAEQTVAAKKLGVTSFAASSAGASNTMSAVVIEGATHLYPNGTNHPVVMTSLLWPFFIATALP